MCNEMLRSCVSAISRLPISAFLLNGPVNAFAFKICQVLGKRSINVACKHLAAGQMEGFVYAMRNIATKRLLLIYCFKQAPLFVFLLVINADARVFQRKQVPFHTIKTF